MPKVYVNGAPREVEPGTTVAEVLAAVGAPPAGIAVELNATLVRRADFAARTLAEGDRLEVVGLVGGG